MIVSRPLDRPPSRQSVSPLPDRREVIFHDKVDRQDFLKTLAEACLKADYQVHAYCSMSAVRIARTSFSWRIRVGAGVCVPVAIRNGRCRRRFG